MESVAKQNNFLEDITQIRSDVSELKRLFHEQNNKTQIEPDQWFDLNQLLNYLPDKPAKATVYAWVSSSSIPNHKGGKKLRFLKSEIDAWMKAGKRKTISEVSNEADELLKRNGGK